MLSAVFMQMKNIPFCALWRGFLLDWYSNFLFAKISMSYQHLFSYISYFIFVGHDYATVHHNFISMIEIFSCENDERTPRPKYRGLCKCYLCSQGICEWKQVTVYFIAGKKIVNNQPTILWAMKSGVFGPTIWSYKLKYC